MKVKELKKVINDMIKNGKEEYDVCIVEGHIYDTIEEVHILDETDEHRGTLALGYL